ncbi:hypothetical protein AWENTII_011690 [Aspergillus wentii]|nr:hypothetical protein MW887_006148 [Aspergillus wentii]
MPISKTIIASSMSAPARTWKDTLPDTKVMDDSCVTFTHKRTANDSTRRPQRNFQEDIAIAAAVKSSNSKTFKRSSSFATPVTLTVYEAPCLWHQYTMRATDKNDFPLHSWKPMGTPECQ